MLRNCGVGYSTGSEDCQVHVGGWRESDTGRLTARCRTPELNPPDKPSYLFGGAYSVERTRQRAFSLADRAGRAVRLPLYRTNTSADIRMSERLHSPGPNRAAPLHSQVADNGYSGCLYVLRAYSCPPRKQDRSLYAG